MKLPDYLKTHSQSKLAKDIGVSQSAIWQWATGMRPLPAKRCVMIENATAGVVSRKDLRPDDWHLIWPDLAISDNNTIPPRRSTDPAPFP